MKTTRFVSNNDQELPGELHAVKSFAAWRLSVEYMAFKALEFGAEEIDLTPRHVHRLRVAARKFRAGLVNFRNEFPKADFKQINNTFRQLSMWFAEIRELDVLSEELEKLISSNSEGFEHELMDALQKSISAKRKKRVAEIIPAASVLFQQESHQALENFVHQYESEAPEDLGEDADVREFVQRAILDKLIILYALEGCLREDQAGNAFHQMRIALKNLKYSFEQFSSHNEPLFLSFIAALRPLQDQMGLIHDLDVCYSLIDGFFEPGEELDSLTVQGESIQQMKTALKTQWQEKSRDEYRQFQARWNELSSKGFWDEMESQLGDYWRSK